MKRLLIVLACFAALAAFGATAARADAGWNATLTVQPTTLAPGDIATFSGVVTTEGALAAGVYVVLNEYSDAACTDLIWSSVEWESGVVVTAEDGAYSFEGTLANEATRWFSVEVWTDESEAPVTTSECVAVTWTTEPVEPLVSANPSSFLCWNHEMTDPVAYLDAIADEMWATGKYFAPQAILGNVGGGTNLGAYHLVCNAPSTLKPTGQGIGGSGEVYSADVMAQYQHGHASNGADLNLYRVYG